MDHDDAGGGGASAPDSILPDVPEGAQAVSLFGEPLMAAEPNEATLEKLAAAKADYEADPNDADTIIWYGRRTAYAGDFRGAILIYTKGIEKFPEDARMYRHRGHRYISIRQFDRAIADFEQAAQLIEGTEDQIEPDGIPNAQNTPISSLHSNIWYHLGLAYYLKHDLDNALRIYRIAVEDSANDDKIVSTTHWLYMTLRLLGRDEEAAAALEPINSNMNIIENMAYYQLCLFYKGEISEEEVAGDGDMPSNDAAAYGIGNWHFYNGDPDRAREIYAGMLTEGGWASFGYIAAEADWLREFGSEGP